MQAYRDQSQPLFQRYQIESQIAAIHEPVVQLRSGGYIVLNQTEALVAIDVNSGRATRERNIEETALRTNVEAAEEVARQLRLRDLAGLIVIDFIDMEENRNNAQVERRLKEALKNDRARIQIGRISTFGLLEMSRQRLHPSLVEASTEACPHCHGTGRVRSVESTALHVLRMAEEEIARSFSPGVTIFVPTAVALVHAQPQAPRSIEEIEQRRGVRVYLQADDELTPPEYRLDRIKQLNPGEEVQPRALLPRRSSRTSRTICPPEELEVEAVEAESARGGRGSSPQAAQGDRERGGRRRRRRRGRGGKFRADEFTESDGERRAAAGAIRARSRGRKRRRRSSHWLTMRRTMATKTRTSPKARRPRAATAKSSAPMASRAAAAAVAAAVAAAGRGARSVNSPARRRHPQGRQAADGEQPLPGLGDQPELPEMPEQWTQRVAPLTGDGSEPAAASEGTNGEQQAAEPQARRRQRRPRRRDDEAAAPAATPAADDRGRARNAEPGRTRRGSAACTGSAGRTFGRGSVRADHRSRRRAGRRRGRPAQARLVAPADRVAATPFGRFHNPFRPRGRGYSRTAIRRHSCPCPKTASVGAGAVASFAPWNSCLSSGSMPVPATGR